MSLVLSLPLINAMEQIISDDKKELIVKTQSKPAQENTNPSSDLRPIISKRASFMPSRGKKEDFDEDLNVNMKKASSFMPMRGRKDYYTQQNEWNSPNQYGMDSMDDNEKRAGFMPMRGRKNGYESDNYQTQGEDVYQSELESEKRSSFMPMRGRKDDMNPDYNVANHYGQQEYAMPYYHSQHIVRPNWIEGEYSGNENREVDKKANAFFGARGKRSAFSTVGQINQIKDAKRSIRSGHHDHNENFFATRG